MIKKIIKTNIEIIKRQLILLFIVISCLFIIIAFFSKGFFENWINIIYPLGISMILTLFCLFILLFIEYIKQIRENRFFKKIPYKEIENLTYDKLMVAHSKYDYKKTQRIIKLEEQEYAIEYYDDFFKNSFPTGVLLVYNRKQLKKRPLTVDFKSKKYSKMELLNLINQK